jgi:ABC-type uncharacterized transport system auxiliary subunit
MILFVDSRTSLLSASSCGLGLLLILMFSIAGCALRSGDAIKYYALDYPGTGRKSSESVPDSLMVYQFLLGPGIDTYALVLAGPGREEKAQTGHRWRENPADMLTDLILRDLDQSRLFKRTVDQFSSAQYRYALEGTIRTLRGVVTDGSAYGQVEIEAMLTDFEAPRPTDKTVMKKVYKISVPSVDSSPAAIIGALNQTFKEFSQQLRSDIAAAFKKRDQEKAGS